MRSVTKKIRLLLVMTSMTCLFTETHAQVMYGATLGNYSGISGLQLNPSAIHHSKTFLDIRLIGGGLFIQNDALYYPKEDYKFSNFFKSGYQWPMHTETWGPEERLFYRYNNEWDKNAFLNIRIDGPGAMLIWKRHGFGISTGARIVSSLFRLPYDVVNFAYLGLNYWPQQNLNFKDQRPFNGSAMAWGEIGLTYSYLAIAREFHFLSAGVTVKRLFGAGGIYVASRNLDYFVPNDQTIQVNNLDAEVGLAIPLNYDNNSINTDQIFKGQGFGFDVGLTYTRLKKWYQPEYSNSLCSQVYHDYIYRIGVALVDIGGIRFKNNATKVKIDNRGSVWTNLNNLDFQNVNHFLDTLSYRFYGDTTSAYAGDQFTMWLPAALSVQFDYHIDRNFYVNTSLIYGFPVVGNDLVRPPELAVTPRYETDWLEVNMPVSLYNWTLPRIGLSLRVYGFTIGTEKLGGFLSISDFTGLDFYFSFRYFLERGKCRERRTNYCSEPEKPF